MWQSCLLIQILDPYMRNSFQCTENCNYSKTVPKKFDLNISFSSTVHLREVILTLWTLKWVYASVDKTYFDKTYF